MAGNMAILKKCCCNVPCQSSGSFNFHTNAFSPVCSPRIAFCIDGQTGDCAVVNAGTDAIIMNRTVAGNPATYEYIEAGVKKYEVILTVAFGGVTQFIIRTYRWDGSAWVLCTEDGITPTHTMNNATGYGFVPFTTRRLWALDSWIPPYLSARLAGIAVCTDCYVNPALDDADIGSWKFSNLQNVNTTKNLLLQPPGTSTPWGVSSVSDSVWKGTQGTIDVTYWLNSTSRSCAGTPDGQATMDVVWWLRLWANIAQLFVQATGTGLPTATIFQFDPFDAWNDQFVDPNHSDDYFSIPCAGEEKSTFNNANVCGGGDRTIAASGGTATLIIPAHGS